MREGGELPHHPLPKHTHTHSGICPLETSQPWPWELLDSCYVPGPALDTGPKDGVSLSPCPRGVRFLEGKTDDQVRETKALSVIRQLRDGGCWGGGAS